MEVKKVESVKGRYVRERFSKYLVVRKVGSQPAYCVQMDDKLFTAKSRIAHKNIKSS